MEGSAFYTLRSATGEWLSDEIFAEKDLALRAARCCAAVSAVEVWRTAYCGNGIFGESYVATAFPRQERRLQQATAIELD